MRVRDPIHGMIELNKGEEAIIQNEAFQRLRHIRQLSMSYKVYPGATHTRFEHSIGVMHLAGRMMDSLYQRDLLKTHFAEDEYNRYKQIVRLAGLLHDVGHPPFSHGGEGLFPAGTKHEDYSISIIEDYFAPIVHEYFENINIQEIISLLDKGFLSAGLLFAGKIIDGEMDADKLDYLLRDSYYCGVRYGKYDLERILDTVTVIPVVEGDDKESSENAESPGGFWMLGIDSDGIQAIEELIFARYWMFIQVYFHKTRRIYDYYLTNFLKDFLKEQYNLDHFPGRTNLAEYISLDDSRVLEAIKQMRFSNEWARRIYERDHLSEAFVTLPHHTGLESYMIYEELKEAFKEEFSGKAEIYIDDNARKLPTNPLFGLRKEEGDDNELEKKMASILVQDKHVSQEKRSIFEMSLPLQLLSQKTINIVRFYIDKSYKEEAGKWCREKYEQIASKVKRIEEGWR